LEVVPHSGKSRLDRLRALGIFSKPFFIMWKVYIIYSEKIDRYYTGITDDIEWRLERHNQGWGRYTKRGIPWKVVYTEDFATKSDALKREREIKNRKSRNYIENLISK
jgi:putative endonuclease